MTEQWADPRQEYQSDLVWAEESASELDSIWDDEYFSWDDENDMCLSLLCTAHDPIPTPDGSMDWRPEYGRQDASMGEAATDCDVAAETMVSTDIEMLDASTDAEEPEEMDWEPCHCTDADNDIVMRDMA
ncbi:hypothetical protein BBO_06055 [Beauveria brongniartii RCEF 3172]|uniref:Uncharacterized protein n=1 Tax=Beauveria brongniartii RCEF 3172 TaxID=1081107 RepID=A0A167BVT0_9HYPO|nr:hypothetical protein BBO_06055 [Beauveria brongniartii RCEF 3172]